jgi:uncharacterized repeat protein (TIGR01451 family)
LTNQIPTGATLVSSSISNFGNPSSGALCYQLGNLAMPSLIGTNVQYAGTSFTVSILPGLVGAATNVICAYSDSSQVNPADNQMTNIVQIAQPSAELFVGISALPSPVMIGSLLTYTISVSNAGPSTATGLMITNLLPPGVSLVSTTPSNVWNTASDPIVASLGDLGANSNLVATVTVRPEVANSAMFDYAIAVSDLIGNNPAYAFVKTEVDGRPLLSFMEGAKGMSKAATLSWLASGYALALESTTNLSSSDWVEETNSISLVNGTNVFTVSYSNNAKFYRLRLVTP